MVLMFEKGTRGGISMISHRYAKANNEKVGYNPDSKSHIMYFDANNLYGWAMCKFVPIGNFKWCNPSDFDTKSIMKLCEDARIGYTFMVDLEYPEELHDRHNDYPFAPEKFTITHEMSSPYNRKLNSLANKTSSNDKKIYN